MELVQTVAVWWYPCSDPHLVRWPPAGAQCGAVCPCSQVCADTTPWICTILRQGSTPFLRVRILLFNELVAVVTTRHENTHCSYFCSMCFLLSISFACKSYGYFMVVHLGWKGFRWWFWTAVWIMDRGGNKEASFRIKYPRCDGVLPSIWTDDWEYHLPRFSQSCTEAFMRWPLVCGK